MRNYTYTAYHGSKKANKIKKEGFKKIVKKTKKGQIKTPLGYHFTKNKINAKPYGKVITARVQGKFIPEKEYFKIYNQLIREGYHKPEYSNGKLYGATFIAEIKRRIKAKGYNGIDGEEIVIFNKRNISIR